jgi:hypothetical protein
MAVQELRNWTCGTVLPSLAGGCFVVRVDLGFGGWPAFRSTASWITWWRCLFRTSSSSLLLPQVLLRPSPPSAPSASVTALAEHPPVIYDRSSLERSRAGGYARSQVHRCRYACGGSDAACWRLPSFQLQRHQNSVCFRR